MEWKWLAIKTAPTSGIPKDILGWAKSWVQPRMCFRSTEEKWCPYPDNLEDSSEPTHWLPLPPLPGTE